MGKRVIVKDPERYKTVLCHNNPNGDGHCPYGPRCQFAHGMRELRYRDCPSPNGKTARQTPPSPSSSQPRCPFVDSSQPVTKAPHLTKLPHPAPPLPTEATSDKGRVQKGKAPSSRFSGQLVRASDASSPAGCRLPEETLRLTNTQLSPPLSAWPPLVVLDLIASKGLVHKCPCPTTSSLMPHTRVPCTPSLSHAPMSTICLHHGMMPPPPFFGWTHPPRSPYAPPQLVPTTMPRTQFIAPPRQPVNRAPSLFASSSTQNTAPVSKRNHEMDQTKGGADRSCSAQTVDRDDATSAEANLGLDQPADACEFENLESNMRAMSMELHRLTLL